MGRAKGLLQSVIILLLVASVEVSVAEHFTVDKLNHTVLGADNETLTNSGLVANIALRAVVDNELLHKLLLAAHHEQVKCSQVSVTDNISSCLQVNRLTGLDESVDSNFSLSCFFSRQPVVVTHVHTVEEFLTTTTVNNRLNKENVAVAGEVDRDRLSNSCGHMALNCILSVRSEDDMGLDIAVELVCQSVRSVGVTTTEADKVALVNTINTRQILQASSKNTTQVVLLMVLTDIGVGIVDLDKFLVEDRLSADEELTSLRVSAEHYSRTTVDLESSVSATVDSIQHPGLTGEDEIFGVFLVSVWHNLLVKNGSGRGIEPQTLEEEPDLSVVSAGTIPARIISMDQNGVKVKTPLQTLTDSELAVGVDLTSTVHDSVQVLFELVLNVNFLGPGELLGILVNSFQSGSPDSGAILVLGHSGVPLTTL